MVKFLSLVKVNHRECKYNLVEYLNYFFDMKNVKQIIFLLVISTSFVFAQNSTVNGVTQVQTVLFKNQALEVMKEDEEGVYTLEQASLKSKSYNSGWRLPTKVELNFLYNNKDRIGGFKRDYYVSSDRVGEWNVWCQSFANGKQFGYSGSNSAKLRCVRSVK